MSYQRYSYRSEALTPLRIEELKTQDALAQAQELRRQIADLEDKLQKARREIGTLRSRIWHFKNRRKPRRSFLKAVPDIVDYSGPEGLKAAAAEAHNYYLRKKEAA